jgi:hypothetical protein
MLLSDLTVEIRDVSLNRVALLVGPELVGATFVSRFNNVGSWTVRIPNGFPNADLLRTPGYGLIVTGPQGVIISGPTLSAQLDQGTEDPQGVWVITGADDSIVLEERLAYPDPSEPDVSAQTVATDTRTGAAETVIKEYIDANIGPSAPAVRRISDLTIEADEERGETVFASARFDTLQELSHGLATPSGLGYTIKQIDQDLEFQVYEPLDRTAEVRMDIANNQVTRTEYSYTSPKVTRAIVGGAGEAVERLFLEATTADSVFAEDVWNRRIESFIDNRGSEEADELTQSALEKLTEDGTTIVNISVSPTDDSNMRYGFDWNLGDQVTVVVDTIEAQAVVTEVGISIQEDGVRVGATVGNPTALDFESKLVRKAATSDQRISNLERNTTGFGISTAYQPEGGTDGTQPTFSGPAIQGSYTRFGNMVYFSIQVDFDNITSFGTGQYYVTLPYPSKNEVRFGDGCLHDVSTARDYQIRGAVLAGEDVLKLSTTGIEGQRIFDVAFTATDPVTLTSSDFFHIAGTYEIEA